MKNTIGLFAALCLALVVALFVYFFQKNASKHAQEAAAKVEMVAILVAGTPLKSGDRVELSKFEWAPWPVNAIQADYIRKDRPSDKKALEGAIVRGLILKGEPLKKGDIVVIGDKSAMTAFVRAGMRAESIPFTKIANPSVHYAPGDYVDVIFTKRSREGKADIEEIIRAVRIIAVDEKFAPQDKPESKLPKNITLELSETQAELLADAMRDGNITISHYSAFSPPTLAEQQQPVEEPLLTSKKEDEPEEDAGASKVTILRGEQKKK